MNKLAYLALFALVLVPISAFAQDQTLSIKSIYTVRTIHTGDVITVVNDDSVTHSIIGQDNTGNRIDTTLQPGDTTKLTFMFPGEFAFYDQYTVNATGVMYIFDPSTNLTQLNVYNKTSNADLYEKPQYVNPYVKMEIGNSTTFNPQPIVNSTTTLTPTPTLTQLAPVFSSTNATQDNGTVTTLKNEITLLEQQLVNANNQTSFWKAEAQQWQNIAQNKPLS